MPVSRKVPRPFKMHWGSGQIVEEASCVGEHHEPAIQLMEYSDGDAAATVSPEGFLQGRGRLGTGAGRHLGGIVHQEQGTWNQERGPRGSSSLFLLPCS